MSWSSSQQQPPPTAPALPPRPRQTSARVSVQRGAPHAPPPPAAASASAPVLPPRPVVPVAAAPHADTFTQWREPHARFGSSDSSVLGVSPPSTSSSTDDDASILGVSPFSTRISSLPPRPASMQHQQQPLIPVAATAATPTLGTRARAPSQSGGSVVEYEYNDFDLASEVGSFTRSRPGLSLDLYSEAGTYAEREEELEEEEDNFSDAFDSDSDEAATPATAVAAQEEATRRGESSGIARAFGLTPPMNSAAELGSRTPRANVNDSLRATSAWAEDDDAVWDAEFTNSPRQVDTKHLSRGATSSSVKLAAASPSAPTRRARASSRASAKQAATAEGLLPPPPPARDELSRHSQAVSESWDEDFLFQNDDEEDEEAGSQTSPRGSPTESALAAGGWERTRDDGKARERERAEEEDDESTWDTQTTPGVTASNSAATLLARPYATRPASPPREAAQAETHQRTPSRSSAFSEMTDLSARLAMQSDVSSWRSRFSSAGSSNSRSRTPSLSSSRAHSRTSGAQSSLGWDGDETEEEAELRTSDGGTELGSDVQVEEGAAGDASGDETETESMLGSRTSSRRSSVLYSAVGEQGAARRLSTAKRPTSSRGTFEQSTGSIRRRSHIEARTATPEEPLSAGSARNSFSSQARHSPQMHAPALPMNMPQQQQAHSRRDSTAGASASPSDASLSGTSQGRHERNSSRNSFRAFLKRATSPRRRAERAERETSDAATEPQESSSPRPSISRWRLSSKTDLPLDAEAAPTTTEPKRKGHTKGAGSLSSSFGISRPAWTHHRSSSRDVNAIQTHSAAASSSTSLASAHTGRPITPSGRPITPIVIGPAQSFAAAGDVLQRPQRDMMMPPPSPVRTSSLLPYQRSPSPPTPGRRRAHSPAAYEGTQREDSISPRTTRAPHAVGGIRRVPSTLDRSSALSLDSRTVSASTTATGTSGTGTSDNWTGTSVGGGAETEGTSIFGSSYDSTPPMLSSGGAGGSGIWTRRMSSSSEASVRTTAAAKPPRREPKLMLRQLPEGKAAEGLRSPDLISSSSSRNTSYTSTGAASSTSADAMSAPSAPPSRRGSAKNGSHAAPELRRSQTSQDALLLPPDSKKAPRSARNSLSGSTGRRVARRNSLGDLRIPARISKAQDGIRANITHVRDFARGVDELKELRKHYRTLLSGLQDDELDSPGGANHMEHLALSPEAAAEVAQIDASLAGWWEIADVLIGLGEGRGETDAEASLATLTHSPVPASRERCITLDTQPGVDRRASTIPTPVSFSSAMSGAPLLDQQPTVRRSINSGSNSRASSNSRILHPQRELDILAAMLAGAAPDQVSPAREFGTEHIENSAGAAGIAQLRDASASVTSLTFDESVRPDRVASPDSAAAAAERERRKLARLSLPYRTAPAGLISPFAGISTDSLYQPSAADTTKDGYRKRSANKAARGLQSLLELVRTLKNAPEPGAGAYGAGRTLGTTSQISLGRRFSRRDSSQAHVPPPLPDRSQDTTSPPLNAAPSVASPAPGNRRRSFMAKLRPDSDASADQSPRRKRSTSRLFSRESVDLSRGPPPLPSFERTTHHGQGEAARDRLPSTASQQSIGSAAADTSADSEWVHSSDFDSPGVRQSGESSSGWSGVAGLPGGRRQRVLSFLGRTRGNSVVGPKVTTPTTPTGGQSGLESSASESSPRLAKRSSSAQIAAESNASARPRVTSSTSYGRYGAPSDARTAAITRSASTSDSPSPSSAGQAQLGKPGQLRPSAGSGQTGTSDSDSGWARRAEASNASANVTPAAPLLAGMTAEATFRKLAMSPDAISGLLVHVHAARQHCADGVAALKAVQAASAAPASAASLALPLTEPGKRAPSPLSPPRGSTLGVLDEASANDAQAQSKFDMQATIRGSRDLSKSPPPTTTAGIRGWPSGG